jgi:glycosyltransferase involved in cell wall biosynthesis
VAINADVPILVMVGKPFTDEMKAFLMNNGLQDRVRSIEGCSNEDLRALYSLAELLVFPSLAEGFGWPVIEAQACGCPVLCSHLEPFPETTRGTACLWDPADEPGFAAELLRLLAQPEVRKTLTARGLENARRFSAVEMVGGYIRCYTELVRRSSQDPELRDSRR